MNETLLYLIRKTYQDLLQNNALKMVYSFENNKHRFGSGKEHHNLTFVDFNAVWNSFNINVAYLSDYAEKTAENNVLLSDIFDLNNSLSKTFIITTFLDDEMKQIIIETNSMLVVFSVISFTEKDVNQLITIEKNKIFNTFQSKVVSYYRGQSDASYNLIPSIYRKLNTYNGKIIKSDDLFDIYKNKNLISRYNDIFGFKRVDYDFCSFMQHSVSYSPYLDFSEDVKVALSFACSNKNIGINDYSSKESAIFKISFSEELQTIDEKAPFGIDIFMMDGKLTPFSQIRGKNLYECTYRDFEVKAYIVTNKTNDRMKYQKGVFLFFKKCIIVNGIILMPLSFGDITKYIIHPKTAKKGCIAKEDIYKTIQKHYKHLDYEHLMNPYLYFEDAPLSK